MHMHAKQQLKKIACIYLFFFFWDNNLIAHSPQHAYLGIPKSETCSRSVMVTEAMLCQILYCAKILL